MHTSFRGPRLRHDQVPSPLTKIPLKRAACAVLAMLMVLGYASCRMDVQTQFQDVTVRNQSATVSSAPVQSQCFWMGSNEIASLSWEAVAGITVDGQSVRLAACTNTDPANGQTIVVNGHPVLLTSPWSSYAGATFQSCHSPVNNEFGDCFPQRPCAPDTQSCGGAPQTNFPYCGQNCKESPANDTTYEVLLSQPLPGLSNTVVVQEPTFYPVQDVRTLARKLTSFMPDPMQPNYVAWKWSVPIRPDGTLLEDFSPNCKR